MPGYQSFPVLNQQFIVDKKFQFIREMGQGAYGVVWWVDLSQMLYIIQRNNREYHIVLPKIARQMNK